MFVRQPAVAGGFYPAEPNELGAQITSLINQTRQITTSGRPKILIVPHAGIVYSGKVAAWGFKQIESLDFSKIILLGASHQAIFNHAAVFGQGVWETPLGKTSIEENLARTIIDQEKNIIADINPHLQEHSLEIELIFLQKVLKNFKIVPILISQPSEKLINDLAQKIARNLDEQTLLVVSTDLSHYPSYEIANEVDSNTIKAILSGKKSVFEQTISQQEAQNYPNLDTCACGYEAIRVALKVVEISKIKDFKKIKYENSGDVSGEKNQVVGYVSIVAYA